MSNSYFRFKQFTVHQDRCAMKVSTDACVQGAWTPLPPAPLRVLDVGAGTGLLSLMIAQRNCLAVIDAIEMDERAAAQAEENARDSPFANQITVRCADARTFEGAQPYDLIICNPPFFNDSLLGPDRHRNAARHTLHFDQNDLVNLMSRTLAHDGKASVMLPVPQMREWDSKAESAEWRCCETLFCKDTDGARVHRIIGVYGRPRTPASSGILVIKKADGDYSDDFKELLSPFYLRL